MNRLAACLLSLALMPALAADPPGRVGRLAWVEGEALTFTDPEAGWEPARVNSHLTSENSVWTEPRSRAEVSVGSIALRLEETSQLDIARLDDDELRAHLARGSLSVRVRYFEQGESIVVTTPDARFEVRGNGRFRIDADAGQGLSRLTVFAGSARLAASGGAVIVDTGRSVVVTGGERPSYAFETAVDTALDEWAMARDERFEERQASRYVSPRMTGWEDLDAYGSWRDEPEYGTVWYPTRVVAGWEPYRYGRWTYVRPWGWTWVDDAPWGYAPFHYGRWVHVRDRWGWYPGRYDPRPVWAPALVGWVGGSGWSLTIGSGPVGVVGWYPLSPWDRYEPWYRANPTYVTRVNRVVIVDRRPRNAVHYRDRATIATRDVFGSRRPVRDSIAEVPREVVARQPVVPGSTVLPPANAVRTRPGTATGFAPPSDRAPSAATPGRPFASSPPPSVAPSESPAGRNAARARDERVPRPAQPASPAERQPSPATGAPPPARPAFTTRPTPPAAESMPSAPSASPALPPAAPVAPRTAPRYEPRAAPPTRPAETARPAEVPVQRAPRTATPEAQRVRPEAPRESREARPPRVEPAPPSAAKPLERPAQPARPPREERQPKEDKPQKESGQRER